MSEQQPIIIGAGLSGLLAAIAFPRSEVIEAKPRAASHRALLRFRSTEVAALTGIEFKRVMVRKGIWFDDAFVEPSILLANLYSRKVIGRLGERSIWNVAPVERFIAPDDLYDQLVDMIGPRIQFEMPFSFTPIPTKIPVISTAPLYVTLKALGIDTPGLTFQRERIFVYRATLPPTEGSVFQTIYFPSADTPIYRASITGKTIIVESMRNVISTDLDKLEYAFGVETRNLQWERGAQEFGKITPIEDESRRALLGKLTSEHNLFSLGRFGTWRNILLDDVVHDIAVIKRLIRSDGYARRKFAA